MSPMPVPPTAHHPKSPHIPIAWPLSLALSTICAAFFCFLYITKPSIPPPSEPLAILPADSPQISAKNEAPPPVPAGKPFEETNLRIQHVLTAEYPGGSLQRIDLEVPAFYQSRNLRWTPAEVLQARELLAKFSAYQEKSMQLRMEGAELLDKWNALVSSSIPAANLRADSPSLPENQPLNPPGSFAKISKDSIQISRSVGVSPASSNHPAQVSNLSPQ